MPDAKLTSKGQITLPVAVRRALRLGVGDSVTFEPAGDGAFMMRPARGDIRALKGIVSAPPRPVSLSDMDEAIRRRATRSAP